MQANSRRRRMHPLARLILGASIGSACCLVAGAAPAWAQNSDPGTACIQMLKGAGPVEYAPSSAGIQLRLFKGTERIDYVLRPRIAAPKPPPSPILRASARLPSESVGVKPPPRSESVALPPIQETYQAPSHAPAPLSEVKESRFANVPGERGCVSAPREPSLGALTQPRSPGKSLGALTQPRSTAGSAITSRSDPSIAKRPEPIASAKSLRSSKEKEAVEAAASALPKAPSAAPQSAVPVSEGQDWPDRKALYNIVVLQVVGTISASLMVSLAIVISVFVLLRRLRDQLPILVERAATVTAVAQTPLVQDETPAMPDFFVEETTAQPFDLGPTFEEERLLKEEAERQKEQAVLRSVFEDNLKLRQQLIEMETAGV